MCIFFHPLKYGTIIKMESFMLPHIISYFTEGKPFYIQMQGFYNGLLRIGHVLKTIMRHKILLTSIAPILLLFYILVFAFPSFITLSSFLQYGHCIPNTQGEYIVKCIYMLRIQRNIFYWKTLNTYFVFHVKL